MDTQAFSALSLSIAEEFRKELIEIGFPETVPEKYLLGERRFLGIWNVPMIAEIAKLTKLPMVVELGVIYLYIRAYVIAQDQVIDHRRVELAPYITLLYGALLNRIEEFSHSTTEAMEIVRATCLANIDDLSRRRERTNTTNDDLWSIGRKTEIAIIPSILTARAVGVDSLEKSLPDITYRYLVAMQIVDDLADLEEDEAAGQYTVAGSLFRLHGLAELGKYTLSQLCAILQTIDEISPEAELSLRYFSRVHQNMAAAFAEGNLKAFDPEVIQTSDL